MPDTGYADTPRTHQTNRQKVSDDEIVRHLPGTAEEVAARVGLAGHTVRYRLRRLRAERRVTKPRGSMVWEEGWTEHRDRLDGRFGPDCFSCGAPTAVHTLTEILGGCARGL